MKKNSVYGLKAVRKKSRCIWAKSCLKKTAVYGLKIVWKERTVMIKLVDVSKDYFTGGVTTSALKKINLTVEKGEYMAVMGPSGSGKSTLLNILGCMDSLTGGQYFFDETEVSALSVNRFNKFRKENISFVFQNFALMNHYTVFENAELPLIAKGVGKKQRKEKVLAALETVGIADLEKKLPMNISGGQQQRCAIARAIAADTGLVLADEPTGALDRATGMGIMDVFDEVNKSGKTVIIVTHDIEVAKRTNRIINIVDGQIV